MSNAHETHPAERWGAELATARLAVIALHGRGQPPSIMRAIAERIDLPDVAWRAPVADDSTWYPFPFTAPIESNQPWLDDALAVIEREVRHLSEVGFDADRVVLLGFSQGACLATHSAITSPRDYRALISFTGGFIGAPGTTPLGGGRFDSVKTLLSTAAEDSWVPLWRVEETARLLEDLGADVDFRVHPGSAHEVTDDEIEAARALLVG